MIISQITVKDDNEILKKIKYVRTSTLNVISLDSSILPKQVIVIVIVAFFVYHILSFYNLLSYCISNDDEVFVTFTRKKSKSTTTLSTNFAISNKLNENNQTVDITVTIIVTV